MRKLIAVSLILSSNALLINIANSADEPIETSTNISQIVVSASRIKQPIHEVGSSIAILSADELLERDVRFVADALLEVPSLEVTSYGPRGSQTQVRVRGNEANHVLVLIDGVRVSSASTGEFDLANMSLEGIDKIEVLLGPQSTLYGSDAAAGVISIITKKGNEGFGGHIRTSEGSLETRSQSAQFFGGKNGFHYAVNATRFETDGISAASEDNGNTERDGNETRSANFKAGYDSNEVETWISLSKNHSRYEFDGDDLATGLAVDEPDNEQWIDTRSATWFVAVPTLNDRLNHQVQISNSQYDYETYSVFFGFGSTFITKTDRDSFSYQGSFKINNQQTLQFGADVVTDNLFVSGFSTFDRSTAQRGTYLQWLGKAGSTDITAGFRSDKHKEFGSHNTYRLTGSHQLTDNWRIRGSIGTGFKSPSLQELYDAGAGGNPDLDPEESSSIEAGIEYKSKTYSSSLTLFDQKTTNLIRYVGTFPTGQLENIDDVNSRGAEWSLSRKFEQFDINAAVSWVDAEEKIDGETRDRLRVPEWSGSLLASYFYSSGRLWAQAIYRDDRRNWNWASQEDVIVDEYWLLNIGASYDLTADATLSARIENVTDRNYEEIYSYGTRGRTSSVTVDWRF